MTSLVLGQWWSGEAYPWRLDNGTLNAIRYWCSGSWVPPGARQCPASCAKSMLAVPGGRRNWYHSMVPMVAWPKSNRTHLGHYVLGPSLGPSGADSLHLRLSRISVMPWSTSGRKYPGTPSVISLRACPIVRHAYKHVGPTEDQTECHFELLQLNFSKTILLHHFFHLDFQGVFEFSPL